MWEFFIFFCIFTRVRRNTGVMKSPKHNDKTPRYAFSRFPPLTSSLSSPNTLVDMDPGIPLVG